MAAISVDLGMKRKTNEEFVAKAKALEPKLIRKQVKPTALVRMENGRAVHLAEAEQMKEIALHKDDSLILDFGNHQVGYVTLQIKSVGSPQDAPAFLKLKFAENTKELVEDSNSYDGWISRGWIQEEWIHLDVLPTVLHLPRRYAFRYLEILALDTSKKFQVVIEDATCEAVAAVDVSMVPAWESADEMEKRLDQVSLRTLQNCMQAVFEDGPKRDRRLWIGDLRLQALTNYATFRNFDLVKRCLYLFAGLTREDGAVGACLFIEPQYLVDDTFLLDYSLFFPVILWDYLRESQDRETAEELWETAMCQIMLVKESLNEQSLVVSKDGFWCFIDWTEGLDKQASAQAVYIYALNSAIELAQKLGKIEDAETMKVIRSQCMDAAKTYLWDQEQQVFVSGPDKQVNYASQVWMVLADMLSKEEGRALLNRIIELDPKKGMVTPYMNHHFVEALLQCGEREKAIDYMWYYWGGMLEEGADTFWEMYNPKNPEESPYGSSIVNSYCHAWSCTPSYILRVLLDESDCNGK